MKVAFGIIVLFAVSAYANAAPHDHHDGHDMERAADKALVLPEISWPTITLPPIFQYTLAQLAVIAFLEAFTELPDEVIKEISYIFRDVDLLNALDLVEIATDIIIDFKEKNWKKLLQDIVRLFEFIPNILNQLDCNEVIELARFLLEYYLPDNLQFLLKIFDWILELILPVSRNFTFFNFFNF